MTVVLKGRFKDRCGTNPERIRSDSSVSSCVPGPGMFVVVRRSGVDLSLEQTNILNVQDIIIGDLSHITLVRYKEEEGRVRKFLTLV